MFDGVTSRWIRPRCLRYGPNRQQLVALGVKRDHFAQREPAHVLHDEEVRALLLAEVEHLNDVLVIEAYTDERLAQ